MQQLKSAFHLPAPQTRSAAVPGRYGAKSAKSFSILMRVNQLGTESLG
jgi:hypothetical protein